MVPSSSASRLPSDATLTAALLDAVRASFDAGQRAQVSVNAARSTVESTLGLPPGSLKSDGKWRGKSKDIVQAEFEKQDALAEAEEVAAEQGEAPSPSVTQSPSATSHRDGDASLASPPPKALPRKRKRPGLAAVAEGKSGATIAKEPARTKPSRRGPSMAQESQDDTDGAGSGERKKAESSGEKPGRSRRMSRSGGEDKDGDGGITANGPRASDGFTDQAPQSPGCGSDMSVVIDEEPAPKRKDRPKPSSGTRPKKAAKSTTTKARDKPSVDPHDAEIKRLQSCLLQCGIRKVWSKELARFDTPAAKINHLRQLLEGVGMTGRFSADRARQIKEERELQAEVQAVQDSARRWGDDKAGVDEEPDEADPDEGANKRQKPRRLARGLKDLGFLGDDGEETD